MTREINSVAVIGAGTMGSGIAAACAQAGCRVLLLDVARDRVETALARLQEGRAPALDDPAAAERIRPGAIDDDLPAIAEADWICEAIIEDVSAKRALMERVEANRAEGSVVSTNTSGIPLWAILDGMPERLQRDAVVTHFFNPVKLMKLVELVPGRQTSPEVVDRMGAFLSTRLDKGVVRAKDTVNFIGNRIGCFWMLSGLHKARPALERGLTMERVDALLGRPLGIPATGLYGLIDLVGLDVMDLVARNLAANLPKGDPGRAYAKLPPVEQAMLERGQLGRKTGGGFYRVQKREDGSRSRETFDLTTQSWRPSEEVELDPAHQDAERLMFADDEAGRLVFDIMGATLAYAADLVPEIADDVVSIDRAMRWGFNWKAGPFELMDRIGPLRVAERLSTSSRPLPGMLQVLNKAGARTFYRAEGREHLTLDGSYRPVPPAG